MTVCGEKVTGVCVLGKCPHFKRCHPVLWDKYGKIKPQTNEEWLRSASTEQLAEVFYIVFHNNADRVLNAFWDKHKEVFKKNAMEWLKQPHTKE